VHLSHYLNSDLSGIKLGIYAPWFSHANREIVQHCQLAVEQLKRLNASLHDVEINSLNLQRIAHVVTISSEMRAAVDTVHREQADKFALDTRLILALSKLFTGTDYVKAQQIRSLTIEEFERVFQQVDIVVTPATGITAPPIRKPYKDNAESSLRITTELMRFSFSTNLAGLPSLTIPVGFDKKGLPIGFQLISKPWQEHLLLRVGRALEDTLNNRPGELAFDLLAANKA
jgi:Asp-tRNA(Asn)/Glu-tRNA(Gln) amidotransferase A subunit family amidase